METGFPVFLLMLRFGPMESGGRFELQSPFTKGLSDHFVSALDQLAQRQGWWQDVLADKTLVLGIRNEYMNVYWKGQSLFKVRVTPSGIVAATHEKYLLDPDLSDQVVLTSAGFFQTAGLQKKGFITEYRGSETLQKMKRAAAAYAGEEKKGVHTIIMRSDAPVIDVEIAMSASEVPHAGKLPRIDIAALEEDSTGVKVVFWEAKLFWNGELRAKGDAKPRVLDQIRKYKDTLNAHRPAVLKNYGQVARNLVRIGQMSGGSRPIHPLVSQVAEGRPLVMNEEPDVGLIVFGFTAAERDDPFWVKHREKLERPLTRARIRSAGDPKNISLA
jgi:hypothetical protein